MPVKKGEQIAKGRGACQTGKRPYQQYYQVSGAKFPVEDETGREFQAWLKSEGLTMRKFITRWMENEDLRNNI